MNISRISAAIKYSVDNGFIRINLEDGLLYRNWYFKNIWKPCKIYKHPRFLGDRLGYYVTAILCDPARSISSIKKYPVSVHRIIAYAKFGDRALDPEISVHHIDGNKDNNCVGNLRLIPYKEIFAERTKKSIAACKNLTRTRHHIHIKIKDPETGNVLATFYDELLAEEYKTWKHFNTQKKLY